MLFWRCSWWFSDRFITVIIDFVNVLVIINHLIGQNYFLITNIVISPEFLREDLKLVMPWVSHVTDISKWLEEGVKITLMFYICQYIYFIVVLAGTKFQDDIQNLIMSILLNPFWSNFVCMRNFHPRNSRSQIKYHQVSIQYF